ncbi:MAG: hypothetical protein LGR52_05500 [Candidatus Thiosymbion ectosymbiont of Robbea hypermnestra]|nr:hypothetical protein [Candidatus Thiosymbion ectosymbiont of Robbea hypermnestra]
MKRVILLVVALFFSGKALSKDIPDGTVFCYELEHIRLFVLAERDMREWSDELFEDKKCAVTSGIVYGSMDMGISDNHFVAIDTRQHGIIWVGQGEVR